MSSAKEPTKRGGRLHEWIRFSGFKSSRLGPVKELQALTESDIADLDVPAVRLPANDVLKQLENRFFWLGCVIALFSSIDLKNLLNIPQLIA